MVEHRHCRAPIWRPRPQVRHRARHPRVRCRSRHRRLPRIPFRWRNAHLPGRRGRDDQRRLGDRSSRWSRHIGVSICLRWPGARRRGQRRHAFPRWFEPRRRMALVASRHVGERVLLRTSSASIAPGMKDGATRPRGHRLRIRRQQRGREDLPAARALRGPPDMAADRSRRCHLCASGRGSDPSLSPNLMNSARNADIPQVMDSRRNAVFGTARSRSVRAFVHGPVAQYGRA